MSSSARRKEKHRLKREKKKAELRRVHSASPYKRIAQIGSIHACYVNTGWKENGMANVQVIRADPRGGYATAVFLIDTWCAGLKDVDGRLDVFSEELDEILQKGREIGLERLDLETARKLVVAGIHFARENGFRLPPKLDRWLDFLGGVGLADSVNLSEFRKDGKLRWMGSMQDLSRRLIGCSVDDFLSREDVEFITGFDSENSDDEFAESDDSDDEDEILWSAEETQERLDDMVHEFGAQVTEFLRSRGETPSPALDHVLRFSCAMMLLDFAGVHAVDPAAPKLRPEQIADFQLDEGLPDVDVLMKIVEERQWYNGQEIDFEANMPADIQLAMEQVGSMAKSASGDAGGD